VELIPHLKKVIIPLDIRTPLAVHFKFWNSIPEQNFCVGLHLFALRREYIFDVKVCHRQYGKGLVEDQCDVTGNFLIDAVTTFRYFLKDTSVELFYFEECLANGRRRLPDEMNWDGKWSGYVPPRFPFHMRQVAVESEAFSGA